jgi:xylulokinase
MGPCAALTEADGTPVRPAILYGVDARAGEQIAQLNEELGVEEIFARGGCHLTSQSPAPKMLWVAQNEPEAFARARRVFMPSSYLGFRLTGQYVLDLPSASQSPPMYDAQGEAWDTAWCERVAPGIELPSLHRPGDQAGTVSAEAARELTGIRAGTPVICGSIDAWMEAVSVAADAPGDLMVMYGTTAFLIATAAEPVRSDHLAASAGITAGTHALAGGLATSGAITTWIRDLAGSDDHGALMAEAARVPAGANGLLMLPYFSGERSPFSDPEARGVIAGLTLSHTRADLYRAALEATAFGIRHHLDELQEAGIRPRRTVAVGGGTQGDLWPQIVSDVTGLEQEIPARTIGASYGGASLAARLVDGVDTRPWNPRVSVQRAAPAHRALYDELYAMYRDLYPTTVGTVHALAEMQAR